MATFSGQQRALRHRRTPKRFAEAEVLGVPRGSLRPYQPDLPLYSPGHTSIHRTRVSGSLSLDPTLLSVAESR